MSRIEVVKPLHPKKVFVRGINSCVETTEVWHGNFYFCAMLADAPNFFHSSQGLIEMLKYVIHPHFINVAVSEWIRIHI